MPCDITTIVQREVQIVEDHFARVVGGAVGEALLEPGMHMGADQRRHHRLAAEVDARDTCGRTHLAALAHARNFAGFDQECRRLHRRAAVAGNQACAFVELCAHTQTDACTQQPRHHFHCRPDHGILLLPSV
jgi:hypothetical protein